MVISMKEARNLALKAEVVMKERIYHDPYQKYGGDDNNGDFEKVKEVAQVNQAQVLLAWKEDKEEDCEQDELTWLMRRSMFLQKIEFEFEFDTLAMPFTMVDDKDFKECYAERRASSHGGSNDD
ncbi:hypothetical protein GH714_005518 [Hevea brasiliensis]|uniref:Uncharacterized protein n=1 Tax=Hevea brasiliensis TaxID=3981 RepID=A0A6A6LEK6_HEVBR|nr:hypothetical protein GH714_005518 [Hevea brasiliensis]